MPRARPRNSSPRSGAGWSSPPGTRSRSRRRSAPPTTASTTWRRWAGGPASSPRSRPIGRSRSGVTARCWTSSRRPVLAIEVLFWASLGALAWTHVGYPLAAAAVARVRRRRVRREDVLPSVTLIVAAHDEEAVIEGRLENLLALDYPADRLEIVVASDASGDRTDALVEAAAGR